MAVKLARGTRDFGPDQMRKRDHIFGTIRAVFNRFGFAPLETPALEQLDTLMGKYGDEGDKLLFKVLNSGPYWEKVPDAAWQDKAGLTAHLAEKGLRYDLTVPFARFVAMNHHALPLPFRRYQIQPVWRADRPQKGRYREFIQCDADVVGTKSLLCEAEIIAMIDQVFTALGVGYTLHINHRGLLQALAEAAGKPEALGPMTMAIDKLDKMPRDKVAAKLGELGFDQAAVSTLFEVLEVTGSSTEVLAKLSTLLPQASSALAELAEVLEKARVLGASLSQVQVTPSLARGLSYYTGAIFEVKATQVSMGSICGGGRYDNLTEVFGLNDMSGVGISFGVERIYDVMEELGLFPAAAASPSVVVANFGQEDEAYALSLLSPLRQLGISAELYPESAKLKKQFAFAEKKGATHLILAGENERLAGKFSLKDLATGEQETLSLDQLAARVKAGKDWLQPS